MVDKFLKIGGKDSDGLVRGIAVDQSGVLITKSGIEDAYIKNGDYWPYFDNKFDNSKLVQGGTSGDTFTDSLIRVRAYPLPVKSNTDYLLMIKSPDVRIRSVVPYKDGSRNGVNLTNEEVFTHISFKTKTTDNQIAINFCKEDITAQLSVFEVYKSEIYLVEVDSLNFGPNIFKNNLVKQGGVNNDGDFTEHTNRTYAYPLDCETEKLYRVSLNPSSDVRIRNVASYAGGVYQGWITLQNRNSTEDYYVVPSGATAIAVVFSHSDTVSDVNVETTVSADIKIEEVKS